MGGGAAGAVRLGGEAGSVAAGAFGLVEGPVGPEKGLPAGLALEPHGGADADRVADPAGGLEQSAHDARELARGRDIDDDGEREGRGRHAAQTAGAWLKPMAEDLGPRIDALTTAVKALGVNPTDGLPTPPNEDARFERLLKLIDSKVTKSGVTVNTYERAGDISPGSFEFDEPTEAELARRRRLAAT